MFNRRDKKETTRQAERKPSMADAFLPSKYLPFPTGTFGQ